MGVIVTEEFGFGGGRIVRVHAPDARPEAIVFAGDGQLLAPWGSLLERAGLPPTMIVGIDRTADPDEMARIREYSPSFAPEVFAAHERFVLDDVRGWVRSRFDVDLPAERTAALGVSASGEFALAFGVRHPDLFGTVLCASPGGGYRPPDDLAAPLPRCYLVAGTREPFFLANATRWAGALRDAGAEVRLEERDGGHGDPFWAAEFPRMIGWAFGR